MVAWGRHPVAVHHALVYEPCLVQPSPQVVKPLVSLLPQQYICAHVVKFRPRDAER